MYIVRFFHMIMLHIDDPKRNTFYRMKTLILTNDFHTLNWILYVFIIKDADLNDFQGNDYSNLGDKLDPEIDLNDEEDEEEESSLPFELQNLVK